MIKVLRYFALGACAFVPLQAAAQDVFLAFKAPKGLEVMVSVKKDEKNKLFDAGFTSIVERRDDGFYYYQIPAEHVSSLGQMTEWCVSINAPTKYFEKGGCFAVDSNVIPDDGIYRSDLALN